MHFLPCYLPINYNEFLVFIVYKKYCIVYTFGGIMQIVYGAKFFGHRNSSLVDNNSVMIVKIRLKPSP